MADVSNVISGFGTLYTAPKGTIIPSLATYPVTWTGFTQSGYTDDGVEFVYTPNFKDITVDEEMAPVDKVLYSEKLVINVKLAENTLLNLKNAIAGSTLVLTTVSTLTFGSAATTNELVLGFEGPCPPNNTKSRVIIVYRVKATAAVTFAYKRGEKVVYNVQFEGLADSSQAAGARLCKIVDFNAVGS